jgi:hypothetical protein
MPSCKIQARYRLVLVVPSHTYTLYEPDAIKGEIKNVEHLVYIVSQEQACGSLIHFIDGL